MAVNLRDVPTEELSRELGNRLAENEVFLVSIWTREDVEQVVPADKVDEYMNKNSTYFGDRLTELGWELMADLM